MISGTNLYLGVITLAVVSHATTLATDLNLSIQSGGSSQVTLDFCGGTVTYEVRGMLTDTLNEGLAGFAFDLAFSGGPLPPADEPGAGPMLNFDRPAGATGPDGFGGTAVNGRLVRIGGAQNTIKNTAANTPFPIGSVLTGVAQSQVVLVTGSFAAPTEAGTYTLAISNLSATLIKQDEDGTGAVWAVEPGGVGTVTNLTIVVPSASPPATASNSGPVCEEQSVTLFGGPSGMASYSWTGPNGFTSTQQNPIISPAERGTYTLTVTDGTNCLANARTTVVLTPDVCAPTVDCNANGRADQCDIALGQGPGIRSQDATASHSALPGTGTARAVAGRTPHSALAQGQSSIVLSPATSSGPVGSFHTLTALVSDNGFPAVGTTVIFEALSGPHVGVLGADLSDPDGEAAIAYVGAGGEGADQIVASYFDGVTTRFSNTVSRAWLGSLDCNFNAVPDECEASGAPAATLLGGMSRRVHGGGVGAANIAVNIAGRVQDRNVTSEPRAGGIKELRLAFDIAPGGPGADPVAIHQQSCPGGAQNDYQLYAASSIAASIQGTELVLVFTPALANARTYRVTVGPAVTGVPCQSIEVRGLIGDAGSDGRVNATDRSFVVGVWTGSGFSANTDIDASGVTNATDRSLVVGAWTGSQNCAP